MRTSLRHADAAQCQGNDQPEGSLMRHSYRQKHGASTPNNVLWQVRERLASSLGRHRSRRVTAGYDNPSRAQQQHGTAITPCDAGCTLIPQVVALVHHIVSTAAITTAPPQLTL
jgi:hypothetical protein